MSSPPIGGTAHDLTILDGRDGNSDKPLIAIPVAKMKKDEGEKEEGAADSDDDEGAVKDDGTLQIL